MKRACIFCASSPKIPQTYFDDAAELTRLLVSGGYGIVYGGGSIGLMGIVADTALSMGGSVTGVIPKFMVDVEWQHKGVADMRLTSTMSERKQMMLAMADAVIVLPGSTGTMDELFEAMSDKKLGLYHKPIILLNTNGFYNTLMQQLQRMVDEQFMTQKHLDTISLAATPAEAAALCADTPDSTDTLADAAVK